MKNFRINLIIFGFIVISSGIFINSKYIDSISGNFRSLSDNTQNRLVSYLRVSDNILNDIPTDILNTKQLCVFMHLEKGIPLSDNAEINTIIGNKFFLSGIANYPDLVDLGSLDIKTIGGIKLRKEAAEWLKYMTDNIEKNNISVIISSGFRDYSLQEYIYKTKVYQLGQKAADLYAARAGFSEHHLGTAVDILTKENNLKLLPTYTNTKLKKWLENNAYKYGFVQSYPQNKTYITGFNYEPWHYRYIGFELANMLKNTDQTIYEYLYSQYNYCLVE